MNKYSLLFFSLLLLVACSDGSEHAGTDISPNQDSKQEAQKFEDSSSFASSTTALTKLALSPSAVERHPLNSRIPAELYPPGIK